MQWIDDITLSCFNDAWETCNNHFKQITASDFLQACRSGKIVKLTVTKLEGMIKRGEIRNVSLDKLVQARNDPYNAYPGSASDKKSIDYLLQNPASTIVIARIRRKYVLLDGMHRCVVASYLAEKIHALVIKL
jgi:hypothetical protein